MAVWVLSRETKLTPGGRTAVEVLPFSKRRSPSGLLGLRFTRPPSPFAGEGAKKGNAKPFLGAHWTPFGGPISGLIGVLHDQGGWFLALLDFVSRATVMAQASAVRP